MLDAQQQGREPTSARLDLSGGNRAEKLAHCVAAVSLREPAPLRERAIVDGLDDNGLLVPHRVELFKII